MKIFPDHSESNTLRRSLINSLVAFNDQHTEPEDWRSVGFYAVDDDGKFIGGIQGNFEWDWLHVTQLWVGESGNGLGRQLVKNAEDYARSEGKRGIFLDTMAFQAKPFYEKLGFVLMGTITKAAGEHDRYFMMKTFDDQKQP